MSVAPDTSVINRCHRSATARLVNPCTGGGPLNPDPGSEGTTTVNACSGWLLQGAGSLSSCSTGRCSRNEPGQPCVSGSDTGFGPRRPGTAGSVLPPQYRCPRPDHATFMDGLSRMHLLWVARSATASRPREWFDELVFAMLAEEWSCSPAHRKQQVSRMT